MKNSAKAAIRLLCLALLTVATVTAFCACSRAAEEKPEETTTGYHMGNDIFFYKDDTVYRRDSTTGREYRVYQFEYPCDTVIFEENDYLCLSGGSFYCGTYDGFARLLYDAAGNKPALTAFQGRITDGPWIWFSTDDAVYPYAEINLDDGTCNLLKDIREGQAFN